MTSKRVNVQPNAALVESKSDRERVKLFFLHAPPAVALQVSWLALTAGSANFSSHERTIFSQMYPLVIDW